MRSTVFASVNNLYHRPAQKRQIDRQHSRLYHAVIERLPEQAQRAARDHIHGIRSEEHTSEIQSLMRISYTVFCLKKKHHRKTHSRTQDTNTTHTGHILAL